MRRFLVMTVLGLLVTTTSAWAADDEGPALAPAVAAAAAGLAPIAVQLPAPRMPSLTRPAALPALYVAAAGLQAYDAYSTLTVLKNGGVEANPLMKGITARPAMFVALKAGVAAASIMAAERMWKNHNRVGAIVTMVASNAFMAYVATNNARVLGQLQAR